MNSDPDGNSWPRVTFLVPTLNSAQTIEECLQSIFESDYPTSKIEAWILDGYSEDDTVRLAAKFPARVTRVTGNPATAYNSVIGAVVTPLVALVDSDARVSRTWLKTLVLSLETSGAEAAGSRISTWSRGSRWSQAIGAELAIRYTELPSVVERIATTCMIIRTQTLKEIGGFDAALATGYDAALGYELNRLGKTIVFNPEAQVYHLHRPSLQGYVRQQFRYGQDSVLLVRKWPRALAGDSVTPIWMTVQPIILVSLAVASSLLLLVPPLSGLFAAVIATGSLVLALTWIGLAVKVSMQNRGFSAFLMTVAIQAIRAEAWTLGILRGAVGLAAALLLKSSRRTGMHKPK